MRIMLHFGPSPMNIDGTRREVSKLRVVITAATKKIRHMEIKAKDLKAQMAVRRNREADEN